MTPASASASNAAAKKAGWFVTNWNNMNMGRTQPNSLRSRVRAAILNTMADGGPHDIDEFRSFERHAVTSAFSELRGAGTIKRVALGVYQMTGGTMAERITLSRAKGWKKPEGAINVARPSIWGNPFRVGDPSGHSFKDGGDPTPMIASLTLEQVIEFYGDLVRGFLSPEMHPAGHEWLARFRQKTRSAYPVDMARCYLRGHDLACWCKPGEPCHADVLLEIANG